MSGTLKDYLIKDRKSNRVSVVSENIAGAQEAILHYEVIDQKHGKALLCINLETGKPHQIRVQLSNSGHPLTGDVKYGLKQEKGFTDNIALWSYSLEFKHPVKAQTLDFSSFPPEQYPWDLFPEAITSLKTNPDTFL